MRNTYKYQLRKQDLNVNYELFEYNTARNGDYYLDYAAFQQEYKVIKEEAALLENTAEGIDYAMAISSGIVAGIMDSVIVGAWDFKNAKGISNEEINRRIHTFAENNGLYEWIEKKKITEKINQDPNRLKKIVIKFLEDKYKLPGDAPWLHEGYDSFGNIIEEKHIGTMTHHLDDIAHHPTLIGLIWSVISQFNETSVYYNSLGQKVIIPIEVDENGFLEGKTISAKVASGIINWFFGVVRNRHGHLMSDMTGSKNSTGAGMGLPGTILSTLKELSCLPGINSTDFPQKLTSAYKKGIGTNKGQVDLGTFNCLFEGAVNRMDLRTENAIFHELKRQELPIIINEVIVRSFYFIRHLIIEWKACGDILNVNWHHVLPLHSGTINRMMTVSLGVFELMDLADAGINASIKSNGSEGELARIFILRVNFIGLGRFAIAVGSEVMVASKKGRLELAIASGEIAETSVKIVAFAEFTQSIQNETTDSFETLDKTTDSLISLKF